MDALLAVEPPDVGDDRFEILAQPQPIAQGVFIGVLLIQGVKAVAGGNVRIDFRIPDIIIDAVQHAAELIAMHFQGMIEPAALIGMTGLIGMGRRYGGDEIGIDDTALHQVDRAVIEVVPQAVEIEILRDVGQAGGPQHVFAGQPLMLEVVNGVADPLPM